MEILRNKMGCSIPAFPARLVNIICPAGVEVQIINILDRVYYLEGFLCLGCWYLLSDQIVCQFPF